MSNGFQKAIQFSKIGIKTFALSRFSKEAGQKYLLQELGNLPGIPAKMGQILTMRFGLDSVSDSPSPKPMPIELVKEIIDQDNPALASSLESIVPNAMTASLGQVHEATLISGKQVALKIRYPKIDEDLRQQLKIILGTMKTLPAPEAVRIDHEEYQDFLEDFFAEETDYLQEAKAQNAFYQAWSNDFRFVIPEVLENLCTSSILVQSFEPSMRLTQITDLTPKEKAHYRQALHDFFINGALDFGLIHTDLHGKNWGIRRDRAQIVIYDFGATLQLSAEMRLALQRLSFLQSEEADEYLSLMVQLGFNRKKLIPIRPKLKELIELLFEPVRNPDWKPSGWRLQERINELLGGDKWNFRTAGPPWFLMLIRGLNGWIHAMKALETDPLPDSVAPTTKLRVLVTENDAEKINLEFPAHSVMDLEMLMPSGISEKIKEQGISIRALSDHVIRNGYEPQLLFELKSNEKYFKVWID